MTYNITHRTLYDYAAPVTVSQHVARLTPLATDTQSRENFTLKIFPEPTLRKERKDYFGNQLCLFSIQQVHKKLEIITHSRVSVSPRPPAAPEASLAWEEVAALFRDPVSPEVVGAYEFVFDSPQVRASSPSSSPGASFGPFRTGAATSASLPRASVSSRCSPSLCWVRHNRAGMHSPTAATATALQPRGSHRTRSRRPPARWPQRPPSRPSSPPV